jgi:transcriptional regulator with XRE-family HTH domain
MPNERISMSKLKQLIGLQTSNLSVRALARALGLSIGAVSKYLRAVRAAGIGAAEAESLSEAELERRVFGPAVPVKPGRLVAPDCAWIHNELKRRRHVTLQLLWEEYAERYGGGAYRRSAFCEIYRRWEKRQICVSRTNISSKSKEKISNRTFVLHEAFPNYRGDTATGMITCTAARCRHAMRCSTAFWLSRAHMDALWQAIAPYPEQIRLSALP